MYFGVDVLDFQMIHQFVPVRRAHNKKVVQIAGASCDGHYGLSKFMDVLRRNRTSFGQPFI